MQKNIRTAVLVFATCVMAGVGYAQVTLTDIGTAAPTPGPYDISQLLTNGNIKFPSGLNYYTDNNPAPGQTFTTTSTSTNLVSVAIRTGGLDSGGGYGTPGTTPKYYLRIYSVSGSTATLITNYVAANPGFTDGDWLKWNNLSLPLNPGATYAYSFGIKPSGGGWCAMAVANGASYSSGQISLIPTNGGAMSLGSYDAVPLSQQSLYCKSATFLSSSQSIS